MEIVGVLAAAIIYGVISYINTQNTNETAIKNQATQNQWNAEQAEINRRWNAPLNQMEQFKMAGINPAAAAESITKNGFSASQPATSGQGAPVLPADFSSLANIANDIFGNRKISAETENVNKQTGWIDRLNNAEIKKTNKEIDKIISEVKLNDEQTKAIKTSSEQLIRMNDENVKKIHEEINKSIAYRELLASQTKKNNKETEVLDKDLEVKNAQIGNIEADTALKGQQIEESKSVKNLNIQKLQTEAAQAGYYNVEQLLKSAEIDLTKAETLNKLSEALINDIKAKFAQNGFFPNASFLNNLVTTPTSVIEKGISSFNDAVESMFNAIESRFVKMNSKINKLIPEKHPYKRPYSDSSYDGTNWNPFMRP